MGDEEENKIILLKEMFLYQIENCYFLNFLYI